MKRKEVKFMAIKKFIVSFTVKKNLKREALTYSLFTTNLFEFSFTFSIDAGRLEFNRRKRTKKTIFGPDKA